MTVDPSVAVTQANEALQKAEKASPAPWERIPVAPTVAISGWDPDGGVTTRWAMPSGTSEYGTEQRTADADFIAAARTDVPLLARLVLDLGEQVGVTEGVRDEAQERYAQALRRVQVTEAALAASRADTAKLTEALREHGKHGAKCTARLDEWQCRYPEDRRCTCGLDDALALLAREGTQ